MAGAFPTVRARDGSYTFESGDGSKCTCMNVCPPWPFPCCTCSASDEPLPIDARLVASELAVDHRRGANAWIAALRAGADGLLANAQLAESQAVRNSRPESLRDG